MRAGVVYYKSYPENRGVAQLISLLRGLGVDVDLVAASICRDRISGSDPGVFYFGVNKSVSPVSSFFWRPHPYFNCWKKPLARICLKRRWDFIFVRESLLANTCVDLGKHFSVPVFLDMRENRPDMLKSEMSGKAAGLLLPFYLHLLKSYEQNYLVAFDHIFTVSDELKNWTVRNYSIPISRVDVLGNYPSAMMRNNAAIHRKTAWGERNRLSLVFAGSIDHTRGLQHILPALKIAVESGIDAGIRIIGSGTYVDRLKSISKDMGINDRIVFSNMVPPEKLMQTLAPYDAGVISDRVNSHTNATTPGKLFEYMAIGLPVFSSARKSVSRILEKERCGILFYSNDPCDISRQMARMADPLERMRMGEAGIRAIAENYNEDVNLTTLGGVLKAYGYA